MFAKISHASKTFIDVFLILLHFLVVCDFFLLTGEKEIFEKKSTKFFGFLMATEVYQSMRPDFSQRLRNV